MIARLVHRGVVALDELVRAGVTAREVQVRLRRKRLIPAWRGVYFVGHGDAPPLGREYAALKFAGETADVSDRSAAVLYRLLPPQVDPAIHLSLPEKRASPEGLTLHTRRLHASERTTIHGDIRITTPERTLLDVAPSLDDEQLENVVGDALRRRLTTRKRLLRQLELRRGARGVARLRRVVDAGPQWTASEAERMVLRLIRKARLPEPELNRRVGRRVPDAMWRAQRVIVEIDGFAAHGDVIAFNHDRAGSADRVFDGWIPLRFTWRQLRDEPLWVVARISAALVRAGGGGPLSASA